MAAAPTFGLAGIEQFRGGGGSVWLKIIPLSGNGGLGHIDVRLRGGMCRQLVREITNERIVTDPDLREAIGGLSMVGGGLRIKAIKILEQRRMELLLINRLGAITVNVEELVVDVEMENVHLVGQKPAFIPAAIARYTFNATNFAGWINAIRGGEHVANNIPQNPPATINVPQGEIHPWMFGGYINVDLTNGNALAVPTVRANDPYLISMLQIIVSVGPRGGAIQVSTINHMALGIACITSGGSITAGKLRRVVAAVAREAMCENIDITREMVLRGWDFLSIYWDNRQGQVAEDFHNLFNILGNEGRAMSIRLATLCEQTEFKMMTGIITTIRTINGFLDFPWEDLNDVIRGITGRDELLEVLEFANHIDPPAVAPAAAANHGHWNGWMVALQREAPGRRVIAHFPNLLYTSMQLAIQVGGDQSLRQYQGLENHIIAAKTIIDNWIGQFIQARNQAAPAFQLVAPGAAAGQVLQGVRNHRL